MRWMPWVDYKPPVIPPIESIKGPPCSQCKNWEPKVNIGEDGDFHGVSFCNSEEMFNDFSCYREKK